MYALGGWLELLTPDQLKEIHLSTLDVLEDTGVHMPHREALERLEAAGARVDFESERVRLPACMVEKSVRHAPAMVAWHGRDPRHDMVLGGKRVYFGTMSSALAVVDLEGKRRLPTVKDCHDVSRLCSALEYISEGYCGVHPYDVPDQVAHVHMMYAMLTNSAKPFKGRVRGRNEALDCIRMAEIAAGGPQQMALRPNLCTNVCPISPLAHVAETVDGMLEYVKHGLPVIITPECQAGATAPATLAGLLVQQNAEVLSSMTLVQTVKPGAPVIYGTVSGALDMKKMTLPYGTAESALINVATAQIARYYGVPCRGTGGITDSNAEDAQLGADSMLKTLMGALGGVNFFLGAAGGTENASALSYAKLVIDNDICGTVVRLLRGIPVTPETLAVPIIKAVGPSGHFLAERHTLNHFRTEQYTPQVWNRDSFATWEASGALPIEDVARARAKKLLEEYQPEPLPPDTDRQLREYIEEVERRELG